MTLDPNANAMDSAMLERLQRNLERLCRVRVLTDVAVVSMVGQKIRAMLPQIGSALEVFEENRIHLLSQAASDLNLSFVVDADQAERLVKNLHRILVTPPTTDAVFGETWEELAREDGACPAARACASPWWQKRRTDLLSLAAAHPSAYVV